MEAIKRQTKILLLDDIERLKNYMTEDELDQVEEEVYDIDKNKDLTDVEKIQQFLDKIDELNKKERFILKDRVERVKVVDKGKEHEEKLRKIMNRLERFTSDELETLRAAEDKDKPEEFVVEVKEDTPENHSKAIDEYLDKMDDVNNRIRDALDKEPREEVKNNAPPRTTSDPVNMDNFLRLRDLSDDLVKTNKLVDPESNLEKFDLHPNPEDPEDIQEVMKQLMDKLEDDHDALRAKVKGMSPESADAKSIDPESIKKIMERCVDLIERERQILDILRKDIVHEQFDLDVEGEDQNVYIEGTNACLDKLDEYEEEFRDLAEKIKEAEKQAKDNEFKLGDLEDGLADQVDKAEKLVELLDGEKDPEEEDEEELDKEDPNYGKKLLRKLAKKQNELDRLIRKKKKDFDASNKDTDQILISMEDLYKKNRVTLEKQIKVYEFVSRTEVDDKVLKEEIMEQTIEEYIIACGRLTERVEHYAKKIDRQNKTDEDLMYEDLSTIYHTLNKISNSISGITYKRADDEILAQKFDKSFKRDIGTIEALEINKQYCLFIKDKYEAFNKVAKVWITLFEKQIDFTGEIEDLVDEVVISKSHLMDLKKFQSFEKGDTFEAKLRDNQLRLQKIYAFIKKVESEGFGGGGDDDEYLKRIYYKCHNFLAVYKEFMIEVTDDDLDHVREFPSDVTDLDINIVKTYTAEIVDSCQEIIDENGDYVVSRFEKILDAKNKAENQYQTLRVFMDDQEKELNRKTNEVGRLVIKCAILIGRIKAQDEKIQG